MSLVDQLLGRRAVAEDTTGDVAPVLTGRQRVPAKPRTEPPKDEEEKRLRARRNSVVASIMGMTESDEESIIPNDAKPMDAFYSHNIPGLNAASPLPADEGPAEPSVTNIHGETLIPPTAALVAPDVTPNVMQPIDPSSVPAAPRSANRPMQPGGFVPNQPSGQGRQPAPPKVPETPPQTPGMSQGARSALDTILGRQNHQPQPAQASMAAEDMAEAFVQSMDNGTIQERVNDLLTPAQPGESRMPVHQESDGRSIFRTFRRFNG